MATVARSNAGGLRWMHPRLPDAARPLAGPRRGREEVSCGGMRQRRSARRDSAETGGRARMTEDAMLQVAVGHVSASCLSLPHHLGEHTARVSCGLARISPLCMPAPATPRCRPRPPSALPDAASQVSSTDPSTPVWRTSTGPRNCRALQTEVGMSQCFVCFSY